MQLFWHSWHWSGQTISIENITTTWISQHNTFHIFSIAEHRFLIFFASICLTFSAFSESRLQHFFKIKSFKFCMFILESEMNIQNSECSFWIPKWTFKILNVHFGFQNEHSKFGMFILDSKMNIQNFECSFWIPKWTFKFVECAFWNPN